MIRCLAACLFVFCGSAWAAPVVLRDARGHEIRLEQPARRIIALTPHLTELVFAAGAGARLAGVARFSDYPAAAKRLPVISDAGQFDLERILALKPDLVLAWQSGTPPDAVNRLERLGLPVFVSGAARLDDITRNLDAIATLADTLPESAAARAAFEDELQALRSRKYRGAPVRVFYEIWPRPLMTVNRAHIISDVIGLCGGINIFGSLEVLTPEVSREALLVARPEVALGGGSADSAQGFAARWAAQVPPLDSIHAFHIPPDLIQRPTPRLMEGARRVCAHLEEVRRARR
ncbi:MAG: helical backbone metal receptor [Burkholderiales bacterium]